MAAYVSQKGTFGTVDTITYVPMTRADRRRRGFNQARLLAEGIGRRLGVPVDSVLAKARETPPQAGLPAVDRRANLRGAFRLVRSGQGRILLVDDIYTTGSTVAECAHALKAGGYKEVFTLTVARA